MIICYNNLIIQNKWDSFLLNVGKDSESQIKGIAEGR